MRHALLPVAVVVAAFVSVRAGAQLPPAVVTPGEGPPVADVEPAGGRQAVIPPGQEELLVNMLGKGIELPGPCKLSGAEAKQTMIRADYACPSGAIAVELYHPDNAPSGAAKTAQFAVVIPAGSPPDGFRDALVERVKAHEAPFEWKWVGRSAVGPERSSPILLFAVLAVVAVVVLVVVMRRRRGSP